jgi:hypothetical protein
MLGRMVATALLHQPPETLWDPELRELAESLDLMVSNGPVRDGAATLGQRARENAVPPAIRPAAGTHRLAPGVLPYAPCRRSRCRLDRRPPRAGLPRARH